MRNDSSFRMPPLRCRIPSRFCSCGCRGFGKRDFRLRDGFEGDVSDNDLIRGLPKTSPNERRRAAPAAGEAGPETPKRDWLRAAEEGTQSQCPAKYQEMAGR